MAIGRSAGKNAAGSKPKPKGPLKTYSVNDETMAYMKMRAEKGSDFFAKLVASAMKYATKDAPNGSLTEDQMTAVERAAKDDEAYSKRPKLKDKDGTLDYVNNKLLRNDKPVCFIPGCRELATLRVGSIGVCEDDDHPERGAEMNVEYAASHAR